MILTRLSEIFCNQSWSRGSEIINILSRKKRRHCGEHKQHSFLRIFDTRVTDLLRDKGDSRSLLNKVYYNSAMCIYVLLSIVILRFVILFVICDKLYVYLLKDKYPRKKIVWAIMYISQLFITSDYLRFINWCSVLNVFISWLCICHAVQFIISSLLTCELVTPVLCTVRLLVRRKKLIAFFISY